MSNLGGYQTMTVLAKKAGGPKKFFLGLGGGIVAVTAFVTKQICKKGKK